MILFYALIIALVCNGIEILFEDGMLLGWLRKWVDSKVNDTWYNILKPVFFCVYCFASFWGSIVLVLLNVEFGIGFLLTLLISVYFNKLLYKLIEK